MALVRAFRLVVAVVLAKLMFGAGFAAASCAPVAQLPKYRIQPASLVQTAKAPSGSVNLTFVGHASFLIETPEGATAVTDYNDYVRPSLIPDLVTMNNVHSTHYTESLHKEIRHVLRGWNPNGGPAKHNVTFKDLRVRNIPTNVRDYSGNIRMSGNSIFLFEVATLCIAHFGHLHHTLTRDHFDDLGPVDVALVPVDGNYTLSQEDVAQVIRELKAPLVIPMHYFNTSTLERFLHFMKSDRDIKLLDVTTINIARETLPVKPTVMVLPGR